MKKLTIAVALLMVTAILSYADCTYNGFLYPTDTIINGLVCQSDGTWK